MTRIEWTDYTPNPVVGCTKQSAGCENCYAIRMAWRLMHSPNKEVAEKYKDTVYKTDGGKLNWTGKINIDLSAIEKVRGIKKPSLFFVNSMGDIFHSKVDFNTLVDIFYIMSQCPQHTFQLLTKQPAHMNEFINHCAYNVYGFPYRLKNVWLGVSIENQKAANERLNDLKEVAAAGYNTWVSNEPALEEIDFTGYEFIKWLVTGGESGHNARPMHPDWARRSRDWAKANNIPFFFKQWGEYARVHDMQCNEPGIKGKPWHAFDPETSMCRVGKKKAGRKLDAIEHNEFPESFYKKDSI